MNDDTVQEPPRVIAGRYEIVRKLGEGGMGAVYQARQISMDRMVALKLIHTEVAGRGDSAQRFHREMKMTSKVVHENTIQVFDFGDDNGQLFLAMEFLDGHPLTKIITGPLQAERIANIGAQIARALGAAHALNIVHRDLKPDNVMLLDRYGETDVVKVLDFGIARFFEGERTQLTADGALVGTPVYMSPEQASGKLVDHRSDIYSLGCILYQMAAGRVPFESTTLTGLLVMHIQEPPQPITALRPDLPPALAELIMQMLEKAAESRPQTAVEVATRLQALLGGKGANLPSTRIQPRDGAAGGGSKTGMILAIAGVVLAGGGVATFFALRSKATVDPPPKGPVSRANIEKAFGTDPIAPAECRTTDAKSVARLDKALAAADPLAALEADPLELSAEYWALVAKLGIAKSKLAGVSDAAKKALSTCPSWAVGHQLAGNAALLAKHFDEAEKEFEAATRSDGAWLDPQYSFALVAYTRGKHEEALARVNALLAKHPDHAKAQKLKATLTGAPK